MLGYKYGMLFPVFGRKVRSLLKERCYKIPAILYRIFRIYREAEVLIQEGVVLEKDRRG